MISYRGVRIKACEGVYVPEDDTFLLAEVIDAREGERVLDLGTGTGMLGLIAAKSAGHVLLADKSNSALRCARENAKSNDIRNVAFKRSDLFSNISGRFDLVIFNPPYLPTEEGEPVDSVSLAWDGGRSGRDVIDRFLDGVEEFLNFGGRILLLGSSLSNYNMTLKSLKQDGFLVSIDASKKLDFEELVVIRADYVS